MVTNIVGMSQDEGAVYVNQVLTKLKGRTVKSITVEADGDFANVSYELEMEPFERIRRITGYLVGTMDRWNDAKRSEESQRVKHG